MKYFFLFLLSQSVLLPIIAGLVRWRRIDKSYRPLFWLLVIGFLVEIISFISIRLAKDNTVIVNIYGLLEWTFLAWQFHAWGFLRQRKLLFYALLGFAALVWFIVNIALGHIHDFSPYFIFFYSFLVVLLGVNEINFMITHHNRNLFRNPRFVICVGLIIYFVYMIVYYWALEISRLRRSEISISISITFLLGYVNILTNIIYTIAFLLIPKPQKFTLQGQ
ncbi:MAG TPA: hypothetical protein VHD83_01815 [Puia sp.]|nr:hypothetical protein [Puia sp.]